MENKSKKKQYVLVDVKVTTFEPECAILIGSGDTNYLESSLEAYTLHSNI